MFRVYKCSIANFAVVGSFSGMDASDMILQQSSSFEALWKIAVVNCLEIKIANERITLSHSSHLNRLSWRWTARWCESRFDLWANVAPQASHWYGFSPVCTRMWHYNGSECRIKAHDSEKTLFTSSCRVEMKSFPHMLQSTFRLYLACVSICSSNISWESKALLHIAHLKINNRIKILLV